MKQTLPKAAVGSPPVQPRDVIGVDLGDRWSRFCVLDQGGAVIEEDRIRTAPEAFTSKFGAMPPTRVVIEVGAHSPWVSRLLESLGHQVIVANARKVRLIYESDRKNDKLDARMLARLGRVDVSLLCPIRHRSAEVQVDLAVVRSRNAVVHARTQLVNSVRGMVKAAGARLPKCTTSAFAQQAVPQVPKALECAVAPLLKSIHVLTEQIHHYDEQIERLAERKYPETRLLRQVKGVGPLIALTYVLTSPLIEQP